MKPATDLTKQPVSAVVWRHRSELVPNDYNPNMIPPQELELLILSILEDGWTQPIVIQADGTIVDGYHRYRVSEDPRLMVLFDGMVPTVIISVDEVHQKMSTVRHNRARGIHAILPMAEIVRGMVDDGVPMADIQRRLGMDKEEVVRLIEIEPECRSPQATASDLVGCRDEAWTETATAEPEADHRQRTRQQPDAATGAESAKTARLP